MAYELSFSESFFVALRCACAAIDEDTWQQWCDDEDSPFNEFMDGDDLLLLATEVNTCSNIDARGPIEVWLDSEGWYTVDVYGLAHYLTHHPDACQDDDHAIWEIYEDSRPCECADCAA